MEDGLEAQIKELIVRDLDLRGRRAEEISDEAALFGEGLGLDSLDALELAVSLERAYGIKLPEGEAARQVFQNVRSLAAYVRAELPRP
jgi:acyl carrier protein